MCWVATRGTLKPKDLQFPARTLASSGHQIQRFFVAQCHRLGVTASQIKVVLRFQTGPGALRRNFIRPFTSCLSSSFLKEIGRRFGCVHFLSDRHGDPLAQGHAIVLWGPLRSLLS
jgi:hypothetical protein